MQICRIFLQGSETIVALNLEELDQPNLYRRVTIFFKDNSSYFSAASREPMYCIFGPLGLLPGQERDKQVGKQSHAKLNFLKLNAH